MSSNSSSTPAFVWAELLNEKEVSAMLNVSLAKLRQDRFIRKGLPYIKLGKSVRYHPADIEAYLANCRVIEKPKPGSACSPDAGSVSGDMGNEAREQIFCFRVRRNPEAVPHECANCLFIIHREVDTLEDHAARSMGSGNIHQDREWDTRFIFRNSENAKLRASISETGAWRGGGGGLDSRACSQKMRSFSLAFFAKLPYTIPSWCCRIGRWFTCPHTER